MSNSIKEGRKKAQDLASIFKQSGNEFIVTSSETCGGDINAIKSFMQGLNEHKVVSQLGKCVFSANDDDLIGHIFVPPTLLNQMNIDKWTFSFTQTFPYIQIIEMDDNCCILKFIPSNESEIFPFKLRDELIQHGITFLKKNNLIKSKSDSDDDEPDYAQELGIEW